MELLQALLLLIGYLGGRVADSGESCANGPCPNVPDRPVVAWTAPQTVRADEVRLFSRGNLRPGHVTFAIVREVGEDGAPLEREVQLVAPARERVGGALAIRVRTLRTTR